MIEPLFTIEDGTSARAITGLPRVCFADAGTALDATWGSGEFWDGSAHVEVTGLDVDPARAPHHVGDFTALGFGDESFDVVVFDPPYQWDMSKRKASVTGARFGTFASAEEARASATAGCHEAWRVARLGVIAKCQDYIHESRPVWMSDWMKAATPVELYDVPHVRQPRKMIDPKWSRQLSVWRNHSTFWVWRKDGDVHRARRS